MGRALDGVPFEMEKAGNVYEMVLSNGVSRIRLFQIHQFISMMPPEFRDGWSFINGRGPVSGSAVVSGSDRLSADQVYVWVLPSGKGRVKLRVWSDAIGQMTAEDPGRALWMISTLVDRELGEVGAMACLDGLELMDDDCDGSPIMLTELRGKLSDMGCPVGISAEECLDVYSTYRLNPPEEDLDWRMDVTVGSTCCAPLVSDYIKAEEDAMNDLQANGATAGFVFYPVEKFDGDTDAMHRFREDVIATIASKVENKTGALSWIDSFKNGVNTKESH